MDRCQHNLSYWGLLGQKNLTTTMITMKNNFIIFKVNIIHFLFQNFLNRTFTFLVLVKPS